MTSVMWFRRDLRLEDNTALKHAFEESDQLILLFHVNPEQFLEDGATNQVSFFNSVKILEASIEEQGGKLHILFGEIEDCFKKLKETFPDWSDVFINRDEKGYGLQRDKKMAQFFKEHDIKAHGFFDHHIHYATEIKTKSDTLYKVFTPYFRQWKEIGKPDPVTVDFQKDKLVSSAEFDDHHERFQKFFDKQVEISSQSKVEELEQGNKAAHQKLDKFIEEKLSEYKEARDFPLKDGTSRMSHHLRAGEISARTVYKKIKSAPESKGKETFIKELAWRDFYNMVYYAYPDQKEKEVDDNFSRVEWDNNEENFERWKEGRTGFPIVDAAMRQLKHKGWMHNRLRMITASFLTKDLLIDWRWGEKYFQTRLVDYDPCSNIGGWQWAASTGTDGVPYFRIFNPTTQSERFDKKGDFIRLYVPELKAIDTKKIHEPSTLSKEEQVEFGVIIGEDYPEPIVNHKRSRELAILAYKESKKKVLGEHD